MNRLVAFRTSIVAAAALVLSACGINSVPAAEETAKAKWADVEAAFQERANLVPNLEQIVMSSAEQERATLEAVVQARASAVDLDRSMKQANERLLASQRTRIGRLRKLTTDSTPSASPTPAARISASCSSRVGSRGSSSSSGSAGSLSAQHLAQQGSVEGGRPARRC